MTEVRLVEWQMRSPEDDPSLRGLYLRTTSGRALADRLSKAGTVVIDELRDGLSIQARAHVGRVQIDDITISIEPKIGRGELLTLLRYAYGLRDLSMFDAVGFGVAGDLLQDLLAAQLLAEATNLAGRGLARRYVERRESLSAPRGRLDMVEFVRGLPADRARLPCRHAERSTDHLLNRVLRAGLRLAGSTAQDSSLRRSLDRLARGLGDHIAELPLSADLLEIAERRIDRQTRAYGPAIKIIRLIHACTALSLDGEEMIALPGFLFDMNRFFQALIGRFLQENLAGFEVHLEHGLRDMMRFVPGMNPRRRKQPRPRPDFLVTERSRTVAILDAKYRDLWEHELPRDMLYQLSMYALSQPVASTATILYPTLRTDATDAVIEICDPWGRDVARGHVALRPVVLSELVWAVREDGDDRGRARLAHHYISCAKRLRSAPAAKSA